MDSNMYIRAEDFIANMDGKCGRWKTMKSMIKIAFMVRQLRFVRKFKNQIWKLGDLYFD